MSEERFLVTLKLNNEEYMTAADVEEISSDKNKYKEVFYHLKNQASKSSEGIVGDRQYLREHKHSDQGNDEKFSWTSSAVKLLINTRLEMETNFTNPTCKKNKLWNGVSQKLQEIGHYRVSGPECDMKYRNVLQTYRQNKEKKSKTGKGKITWEYFELFDDVLGHKASSFPPDGILTSIITDESQRQKNRNEREDIPKKEKKPNVKKEVTVNQYLAYKKEFEERKWAEKKALKEKEIEAIKLLADAINNSNIPGPSGLKKKIKETIKRVRESSESESD